MLNVNELKRNAKNIVKKYSDAQVKVREATSNDPWGPSSTIMSEIADLTYNVVAFSEIMQMVWKRLNDHGKNWRHVFKSLVLLEYLIKAGNEKVAQQCIENIFAIQTLKDFQYIEESKDHGVSIRDKSKKLVALLKDPERLKAERSRALKAKSRAVEAVSSSGKSSYGSVTGRSSRGSGDFTSPSGLNSIGNHSGGFSGHIDESSAVLATDLDAARPHTATEEETQLQIALALSKEEAERMEKTRKNDELRLKLALDASEREKQMKSATSSDFPDDFGSSTNSTTSASHQQDPPKQQKQTTTKTASNIDDLLGLSFTPTTDVVTNKSNTNVTSLPDSIINTMPSPFASSVLARTEPQNDPWSSDPWQSTSSQSLAQSTFFGQMPSANNAATLTTTLPVSTTTVPNAFSMSNTSIFGSDPRKPMSKNPFED